MILPRNSLFRQEIATQHQGESHHLEKAGSDAPAIHPLRLAFGGKVEVATGYCREALEGMVIALPIEEVPGGDRVALPWIRPHHDELIRMRKRQRRKQRRVNHSEDCRSGADTKRESRDDR